MHMMVYKEKGMLVGEGERQHSHFFQEFCLDQSRTIRHSMGAKLGNFYQIEFLPNSHVVQH